MAFAGNGGRGVGGVASAPSKFRYAVIAAAALAHLIAGQGDAVGLQGGERFIAPRAGRHHLRGVLAALIVARRAGHVERAPATCGAPPSG